jgi:NADH-quinone oxidoreductase subunit N
MFSGALSQYHFVLVVLAVVNAVIAVFYYLRVVIAMYFRDADRDALTVPPYYTFVLGFAALATIIIGIYPGFISGLI